METKGFKEFLAQQNIEENLIETYTKHLKKYSDFLKQDDRNIDDINPDELVNYTEYLVSKEKEVVLDFLRAIINFANYTGNYDLKTSVINISESYNAMDTLYSRIEEIYGQSIREEIFKDMPIPPLGVDPEKKPDFTKVILKRTEELIGEDEVIDLLSPCLHGRPPDDIRGDKKKLKKLGIDGFLEVKHKELISRLQKHKENGTLEFAQYIDDQIVEIIRKDKMYGSGIREGNIIYVKKMPYQFRKALDAQVDSLKRFYICYCPWVRGAMKERSVDESLRNFCHCSAGWYKLYWEQIFDRPIKAVPVNTAIDGAMECTIALHIPKDVLAPFIK